MNIMNNSIFLGLVVLTTIFGYTSANVNDIIRRLGKPACNDGTCRSDCADCPNGLDSAGDSCCGPVATATPTTSPVPSCPVGQTCYCQHDESIACSYDQDCNVETTSGTCDKGPRGGLSCTSNQDCPQGQGYATCSSTTTVTQGTCSRTTSCCTTWCEQDGILGALVGTDNSYNGDGSGFMRTTHCGGASYRGTCSATALLQDHYTGLQGDDVLSVCNDPQNMYAPCESYNGGAVVTHHETEGTWNKCELGTFTITGDITADDGACHCSGTVSDGNGGADTYDGGVGATPFTKELWHSGCSDNAKYCDDPIFCLTWQDYQCAI